MALIRRLPDGLVSQIAAGEVVERPASVVKELCENSIDAGAAHVQVELSAGGTRLVLVGDDGAGMEPEDARLSIERHATSKLADAAGLSAIATLGFRGEALAAIASVSRFTLTTRPPGALAATRVRVEGTGDPRVEEAGAPEGTRVEVADLFFATPARRKFLKRAATEAGHCVETVLRLALCHPEVGFALTSDGRRVVTTAPGAPLRERVALALGREVHDSLVELSGLSGRVQVTGYCAPPDQSRPNGRDVLIFVNGRAVRDRALAQAVFRAYASLLPPGRFPVAAILVALPLEEVDVNVHPQKLEVRFADPRAVFEAVSRTVAQALRPAPWLAKAAPPPPPPARREVRGAAPVVREAGLADAGWLSPSFPMERSHLGASPGAPPSEPRGYFSSLRVLGQLAGTYVVCEGGGGALVVLDQHAAHERVLFERLREARRGKALSSQRLLLPAVVELSPRTAEALGARRDRLAEFGFEAEPFGGQSWSIAAVPALLAHAVPGPLFAELADGLVHFEDAGAAEDAVNDLLATMACHAAVRAHDPLSADELRALLSALDGIDFKVRCPHGRPVVTEIPLADLERRVGRR